VRRTGSFTAASDRFEGLKGRKALRSIDARGITARFNPWGVFARRWQLDDVHINSGEVMIQVYEPKPEPSPAKPWYAVFLPDRVYLKHVEAQPADVTWEFRGKRAGFFGIRLLITPHGRDFNYQGTGGTLKMPVIPELELRQTHLLITKTELTLYDLDLGPEDEARGRIHAEGKAGTREDRSVEFKFRFHSLPLESWLPAAWSEHFRGGVAAGDVRWSGKDTKLENSNGDGTLRVAGASIENLPFLQEVAAITKKKDLERLRLTSCSVKYNWSYPRITCNDLLLEEKGKFCVEGEVTIRRKALRGTVELGVAPEYLDWLPKPEEVFTGKRRGYLWTTVHLSGTLDAPEQDLSPRIMQVFKESPTSYLGLLFRALGARLFGD
jgi:hypothetical protein